MSHEPASIDRRVSLRIEARFCFVIEIEHRTVGAGSAMGTILSRKCDRKGLRIFRKI